MISRALRSWKRNTLTLIVAVLFGYLAWNLWQDDQQGVAVSSVAAAVSLIIGIWVVDIQSREFRIQRQPVLLFGDREDVVEEVDGDQVERTNVYIENYGKGPAVIYDYEWSLTTKDGMTNRFRDSEARGDEAARWTVAPTHSQRFGLPRVEAESTFSMTLWYEDIGGDEYRYEFSGRRDEFGLQVLRSENA